MKEKVNPGVAAVVIGLLVLIVGFFVYRGTSTPTINEKPPGMPPDVAAEFQKRMGSASTTGAKATSPANPGGGGYLAPPPR